MILDRKQRFKLHSPARGGGLQQLLRGVRSLLLQEGLGPVAEHRGERVKQLPRQIGIIQQITPRGLLDDVPLCPQVEEIELHRARGR